MNIFYMVMAFVRPVIFIAAVIGFTILMLKIARNNAKRRSEAINQLIDIAVKKLDDGDKVISNDNITNSAEARPKLTMPKERNIQELVIPGDFMFKEEFEILKYMATKYPDECRIFLYEPVSITTISLCEQRMGVKFTDELKALYTFTNGMDFSLCTLGFDFLESIERMHEIGYCDFEKEGDAKDYVIVGDYNGCGDPIVMEKSTGALFTVDHEVGEKSEPQTLSELLYWAIEFISEENLGDDEIINRYLEKFA